MENDKKTSLTIKRVTKEDEGTYVCKATSDIGLAITKAKLNVSGKFNRKLGIHLIHYYRYMVQFWNYFFFIRSRLGSRRTTRRGTA